MSPGIADEWLPTIDAARALGCSPTTLKRKRDTAGGFLQAGIHYALGSAFNSAITWNVEACRKAMHEQGLKARTKAQRPAINK